MARVSLITLGGQRMTPCGSGWDVDGLFFGTWSEAYGYLHDGDIPTQEQVEAEGGRMINTMEPISEI